MNLRVFWISKLRKSNIKKALKQRNYTFFAMDHVICPSFHLFKIAELIIFFCLKEFSDLIILNR